MKRRFHGLCVVCGLLPATLAVQDLGQVSTDDAPIRKMIAAYAQAFNEADAKALAEFWSSDAVYTNQITGQTVQGRSAIADQFSALFEANEKLKIDLDTDSIQFLSPNVAVEHGTAKFVAPDAEPELIQYTALYVRREGKWLLDRVTDEVHPRYAPHYEHLKSLEWMVGSWTSGTADAYVRLDCHWTANRSFLTRAFSLSTGDLQFSGMQVIGWDPSGQVIRSWTFDSNGTFAEATWTNEGKRWFLHNRGVLADGQKASMVNVMEQIDNDSFTWQTVERTAGGELLPNLDEVLLVRQ